MRESISGPQQMYGLLKDRREYLNSPNCSKILKLWPKMNEMLPFGGFELEDNLVTFLAFSCSGKTYLSMNLFFYPLYVQNTRIKTVMFCMESPTSFVQRFAGFITQQNYSETRTTIRDRFDLIELAYKRHRFDNHLKVVFGRQSTDSIRNSLDVLRDNGFEPELITVDYLQLMYGSSNEEGMSNIMSELEAISIDYHCMVAIFSQIQSPGDIQEKRKVDTEIPVGLQAKGSTSIYACSNYFFAFAGVRDPLKLKSVLTESYMQGMITMRPRKLKDANISMSLDEMEFDLYYAKWGLLEESGYSLRDCAENFIDYDGLKRLERYKQEVLK
jgi:hypothetical protein